MLKNILGREIIAKVTDFNDKYIFAQVEGLTFRMTRDELLKAPKVNSSLKGFAYINDNHQLQLTKKVPKVQVDRYAWGTVVSSRKDLGVFVDIGLPNKDIVVSVDDLPELPQLWPQKGDKLMIGLSIDAKDRMWGKLATPEMFQTISGMAKKNMQNKNVTATVYRLKLVGTFVITDDYYLGFIHPSEREVEPRLGEVVKARVIGVKDDGTLNLSTRPRAYEAISDDSQMILMALQHTSAKQLPFTDKSSPDEIKAYFGISKGQFKRAVGHLMKAGLVKQADGFLILNEN
ncbi:CvfB family protein [Ligilactobacillus salivarius]|uniref:CvfB family protein n=1 Tax=Ligilactobacillus salivarius TaxID=1624 RepID=UPI001371CDE7|nr:S1-like domain-containing RNA-binding protein [Ligilactobacillus salivarius]MYY52211.1 DNA-binding protein [Ligilactobacillus salivarius]